MAAEEKLALLKEDYFLKYALQRKNLRVPSMIEDEIKELEQSCIPYVILPKLQEYVQVLLQGIDCKIAISIIKNESGQIAVDLLDDVITELIEEPKGCPDSKCIEENTETNEPESVKEKLEKTEQQTISPDAIIVNEYNAQEAEGRNLRVTFSDGTVFEETMAINTFLKTLRKIGLDKIPEVGILCNGQYNLVDKNKRTDGNQTWQILVDGYYVYKYFSNSYKVKYLCHISDYHGLNLKIEAVNKKNK